MDEKLGQLLKVKNSTVKEWKNFRLKDVIIIPSVLLLYYMIKSYYFTNPLDRFF